MRRFTPVVAAVAALALARALEAQRVVEVQIAPRYLRMRVDAQVTVLATAYDVEGNPVAVPFRWSSSNINVVQVSPEGVIRAVSPGAAVVSAMAVEEGVPKSPVGRLSVFVSRQGAATVTPAVPGVPPVGGVPAPGQPPAIVVRPGGQMINVDSAIRANINCDDPATNGINPALACWQVRARPRVPPTVAAPPSCGYDLTPVTVLVRVTETGETVDVRLFSPSHCHDFTEAAMRFARTLTFVPAQRDGRPIEAWTLVRIHPGER